MLLVQPRTGHQNNLPFVYRPEFDPLGVNGLKKFRKNFTLNNNTVQTRQPEFIEINSTITKKKPSKKLTIHVLKSEKVNPVKTKRILG